MSSLEVTIRHSSTEALLEQHKGKEASSVTSSGPIEEIQTTFTHPVSKAFAVHIQNT